MTEAFGAGMAPHCEQGGRCWVGWVRCKREERGGECRWSRAAREITCALLSSRRQGEVAAWLEQRGIRQDGQTVREQGEALAEVLSGIVEWGETESNVMCELIVEFG